MENNKKCSECKYCIGYYSSTKASRKGFLCEHPNKKYIFAYFEKHKIRKMQGFIGFGKKFSDNPPIKTSPAWCPMKNLVRHKCI